ncbi:MAG: hypothetical protein AAFR64_13790 [Pseudomonadota bacterium]
MQIEITKGQHDDTTLVIRGDGSIARFRFPKKGPIPHDAVHFVVESELEMKRGFWGLVADGMDPEAVGTMAAAAGHASANRAAAPDDSIVELLQAERLVECFEAESWSGDADDEGIMAMAEAGWSASYVPAPEEVREKTGAIRAGIMAFSQEWRDVAVGASMTLNWKE